MIWILFKLFATEYAGGSYVFHSLPDDWSACLSENSYEPEIPTVRVRTVFTDVTFVEHKPAPNHTHGKSAAARSAASQFIDSCGQELGANVIFYQGSKADLRNGRDYSRTLHWVKDEGVPPKPYKPIATDCVAMVDVDYYVDMPSFLANNFRPVFLYTCQPSTVACTEGEYKYTFRQDGSLEYVVSGGATYVHHVWNYDGDSIKVKKYWTFFGYCPILTGVSSFSLERRQVDKDHQLILLAPMCKYKGLAAWVANWVLGGKELRRLNPVVGKFTRMITNEANGMSIHTGLAGQYIKCSVPAAQDTALSITSRVPKLDLQLAQVRKIETLEGEPSVLWEFHRAQLGEQKPHMVSTAIQHVKRYQIVKQLDDFEPNAKPAVVSFMNPIIDGAFAPDCCRANDKRSIEKRVTEMRDTTQLCPFVLKVIKEFVHLFANGARHSLVPVDIEEVFNRQNKPQQRRILCESDLLPYGDRKVEAFVKREAYQKITDPRNISTINGCDKRDYSAFMYAFAEHMKQFDWYAFGKSPVELAQRVSDICQRATKGAGNTDFHRMDGSVGEVARCLEKALMMAMFRSEFHNELHELMRSQVSLTGRTKFGVTYQTLLSRLSGSPETSLFNTSLSAFTAFLNFRMTKIQGKYLTAEDAWDRLGVYGGDDGLTADADANTYATAAKRVGQNLTCEMIPRGSPGVKFLARLYGPEVWFGDCNSMCDLPRTLSKFHTTVALPQNIKAADKLMDKAYALSLSDANTPVVGPFVRAVLAHKPKKFVFKNYGRKWLPEDDPEKQYPNAYGLWMSEYAAADLPEFSFGQFDHWISSKHDLDTLMQAPRFHPDIEVKPAKGDLTILDGDVLDPHPSDRNVTFAPTQETTPKPPTRSRSRPRKAKKDRPSRLNGARKP
jgi:hypothetical protein